MGATPSHHKQQLNNSIHSHIDIGICGHDLGNGTIAPTKCPNNIHLNKSTETSKILSTLKIPNLPVNTCIPINQSIGIELKKNKDSTMKFNFSTCSHNYKTYNSVPTHLRPDLIHQQFVDMNYATLQALENAHYGKDITKLPIPQPRPPPPLPQSPKNPPPKPKPLPKPPFRPPPRLSPFGPPPKPPPKPPINPPPRFSPFGPPPKPPINPPPKYPQ